jgi:5-hydroxyisourate hydrolase-like protein (transthyretin family)
MKRVAMVTVFLSAAVLTVRGQQPRTTAPASTATNISVTGRVVADDTGAAIPNARVTAVAAGVALPGTQVVLTDGDGRFSIGVPATGRARVGASKSGYGHFESDPIGKALTVELRLPRAAAVAGHVVDSRGDPAAGVSVAIERASAAEQRTIVARTETDDRGEYRIGSLPAGEFVVAAMAVGEMVRQVVGPNQVAMFPAMHWIYYPGTEVSAEAETLRLEAGEERPSVDFVLSPGQSSSAFGMNGTFPPERPQDAPSKGTGTIRGRVVVTDGRAVPHAHVRATQIRLSPTGVSTRGAVSSFPVSLPQMATVTADEDGRFEVRGLIAGTFRLAAAKVGYSPPGQSMMFSPLPPDGPVIDLSEGETRERADITLARWGTLTGHVSDELGEPLQGVSVQLMQVRYQAGRRRLVGTIGAARLTDDLGRFRTYGIAPGRYIVSASVGSVQSAELPNYALTYFPGTPNASEAQFVTVGVSEEVTGVDFSLTREKTARVSGTLLDAAGTPTTSGSVRLLTSQRSASATSLSIGARLMSDGRFEFPNVTPGQYVIQVDRGRLGSAVEGEFAALPVSVNGVDVNDLMLQTSSGSSIAGRITFDSYQGSILPSTREIEIVPTVVDPDVSTASPGSANIHDDWTFEVAGVHGPRRLQVPRAPASWTLKEIRVRGIDVTDRPLAFGKADQSLADVEVVLTDRVTTVSGTVVDDHGRPAPAAYVIAFSPDRDRWYPASRFVRMSKAGADGAVTIAGLPPGSYYAAAAAKLPADGNDAWQDPAYLESLVQRATAFSLGEGQKQTLSLKIGER